MRRYDIRKYMAAGMVLLLAITAGCGTGSGITPAGDNNTENDSTQSDDVSEEGVEVGEKDEEQSEAETEETSADLKFLIESKYHSDFTDDDTYNTLFSGTYELIYLTDDVKSYYPELSKALEDFNDDEESSYMQGYEQSKSEALSWYEEMEDKDYFEGYSENRLIRIVRADEYFLSMAVDTNSYMGGAHGSYWSGGYNYDVKTGEKLELKDVITDIPALQEIVKQKLQTDYSDMTFFESLDQAVPEYLTGENDQACSWFITPQGIDIYFGPYMLASYADGVQTVHILYTENPELFFEGYNVEQGDYVESYDIPGRFYTDVNSDGNPETIDIEPQYSEYEVIESVDVSVNGNTTSMEVYGYDVKPMFVHRGGSTFLYIEMYAENDYRNTYALRLTENKAETIDQYGGYLTGNTPSDDYESEWSSTWRAVITSTDDMYLANTIQFLSTHTGMAKVEIDEQGAIVLPENYYYAKFYSDYGTITAKKDIKAASVDIETKQVISEDEIIPSGSRMLIYGSDGETYADLKDEQGSLFRVYINSEEWPQTIDGVDIEELFDGIMFAG